MAEKSRGPALTVLALLYVLLAISDFAKPILAGPGVGFVFAGTRLTGRANAIMGPLFGLFLLYYAYGIWSMRHYALPASYVYAGWVIGNTIMFAIKNSDAPKPSLVVAIASTAIGIGVPIATAIILSRRSAELS
jgi:hypothetical protein